MNYQMTWFRLGLVGQCLSLYLSHDSEGLVYITSW